MVIKNIFNLVPIAHAAVLLDENLKVAKGKRVKAEDLMKLGVKNVIGIEFIKLESGLIGKL